VVSDRTWYSVVAGVSNSVTAGNPLGSCVEGKYCVADGWVIVESARGERIGTRKLLPDENPKTVARNILKRSRPARTDPCAHLYYWKGSPW
jgi:hypothetical protein